MEEKIYLPWKFVSYKIGKKMYIELEPGMKMDEKPSSITLLTIIDGFRTKNEIQLKNEFRKNDEPETVVPKPPKPAKTRRSRSLPPWHMFTCAHIKYSSDRSSVVNLG